MRLLLDTHVLIWAASEPERLSDYTKNALRDPRNTVFVSAASAWEIAIKSASGRLVLDFSLFPEGIHELGFQALDITIAHASASGALPLHHADPFDRMLIAQAQLEAMALVTADRVMKRYGITVFTA
jgi:PIN domain nuclease of toxin-antitoxin system